MGWYAHTEVESWLLTKPPASVVLEHIYDDRGWPTFEKAISSMITPSHRLYDIGKLDPTKGADWTTIEVDISSDRWPPKAPEVMTAELAMKHFTNGADLDF